MCLLFTSWNTTQQRCTWSSGCPKQCIRTTATCIFRPAWHRIQNGKTDENKSVCMTLAHNEYAKVVIHSWIRFGWFQQWHVNLIHIFSCYKNHSTLKWPNINSLLGLSFNDLSTSPRLAYTQDNNGVSFTSIEPGQLLLLCKIYMCHSFTKY